MCTCSSDGRSAGPPVRRPRVRIPPGACREPMEVRARSSTGTEHRITNPEAGGSNPSGRTEGRRCGYAPVAQLEERQIPNLVVGGSNPSGRADEDGMMPPRPAGEAGVPERPKGPVCKTGGESLRGFESRPLLFVEATRLDEEPVPKTGSARECVASSSLAASFCSWRGPPAGMGSGPLSRRRPRALRGFDSHPLRFVRLGRCGSVA